MNQYRNKINMFLMILILLKRFVIIPICVLLFIIFHMSHKYDASTRILKYAIDELGGFFIKTIQFLASHHDVWLHHEKYIQVLDSFYDNAHQINLATVTSVLKKYRIQYESIDDKHLGSGSIAQIHRGRWKDKDVVFKIQKPIAQMQFQIDLLFIQSFLCILTWWIGEIPSTPFLYEFIDCVQNEFDFNQEARAMIKASTWFEGCNSIIIPIVHLHTDQLIIMDFVDHDKISDSVVDMIDSGQKLKMCQDVSDAFSKMIMDKKFIHTDPHIGNLCISKDKKSFIIFDWGQNKSLSDSTINGLAHIIISNNMDLKAMKHGMELCGIDIQSISIEHIMLVLDFFNHSSTTTESSYIHFWKLIRGLIQHTAEKDRHQRNPFKKQSKEIVLILKTHDLLEVIMNKMKIPTSIRREMFPKSMMEASKKQLFIKDH